MGVSFHVKGTKSIGSGKELPALASSELSIVPIEALLNDDLEEFLNRTNPDVLKSPTTRWAFFNRLIVPEGFTPKNASILLMKATSQWADTNQIGIIDALNPYGKLNLKGLLSFNKLFGFKHVKETLMVRLPSIFK
jgi:hypothetical protein